MNTTAYMPVLIAAALMAGCGADALPTPSGGGCGEPRCACLDDSQCGGATPRCDKNAGYCAPCLPLADNCPKGTRCVPSSGSFACSTTCATDADCPRSDAGSAMICCNGACFDAGSDTSNCGGCGKACTALPHAAAMCSMGRCGLGACNASFADCDSDATTGCETNVAADPKNCGRCGQACAAGANQGAACEAGTCRTTCAAGFAHCSMNPSDGCEVDTRSDDANCGACGMVCGALPHGQGACMAGSCAVQNCSPGFGDCNHMAADGCESDLGADVSNCGACGQACPIAPNGTPACKAGRCVVGMCAAGFADCDALPANGCETAVQTDVQNCGGCGRPCAAIHSTPQCQAGVCSIQSCAQGYADCDGRPETGCEIGIATDAKNCGGCGLPCSAPANGLVACQGGICILSGCKAGFADCNKAGIDGCEVDIASSLQNCGACGKACGAPPNATPACKGGACGVGMCNAPWADCDNSGVNGCERDLTTDPAHCGGCGKACSLANAQAGCQNSQCTVAQCNAGFGDCDGNAANGCEVNVATDVKNCGKCGAACPVNLPLCQAGQCVAALPSVLVLGSETVQGYYVDVQNKLAGTGAFSRINVFDGRSATPSLMVLKDYDAVLVWANQQFLDPTTVGNNLADYYDGGGRVVVAVWSVADTPLGGRFGQVNNGYLLITPAAFVSSQDLLGQILEPQSPLVAGVSSFTAVYAARSTGAPVNGGVVVAKWNGGLPLVVRGVVKGRNRVDLNFWPVSNSLSPGSWKGDGAVLLKNALLYQ